MKVLFPTTLDEACAILADEAGPTEAADGDRGWLLDARPVVPVAGGTDVLVHWPERLEAREHTYLDLGRIGALRPMRRGADVLELGATTTYWDLERDARTAASFPMLVEAARQVGAIQIQARGTWAGNVANASPAADGVPALMALDAVVVLVSRAGRREVPLDAFYLGYKALAMRPDELIVAIRLPLATPRFARFVKVGSRRVQAIAKVGLAVARLETGWRVVAASVAPTVRRCRAVEALLDAGERPDRVEDLSPALDEDVAPIDDLRSTAAYRRTVLARVLLDALREARAA